MRRLALAVTLVAAIPAAAIPLVACVAAMSAPAVLIAAIATIALPAHDARPPAVSAEARRFAGEADELRAGPASASPNARQQGTMRRSASRD